MRFHRSNRTHAVRLMGLVAAAAAAMTVVAGCSNDDESDGTGTDIGKTYVSCALIRALKARGAVVDAFKPVVSGFDPKDAAGSDPARLAAQSQQLAERMIAPLEPPHLEAFRDPIASAWYPEETLATTLRRSTRHCAKANLFLK